MKNAKWTGDLGSYGLWRADGENILNLHWQHDEHIEPHWEVHFGDLRVIKLKRTACHFDAIDFAKEEAVEMVRKKLRQMLAAIEGED